jgi:hypothetical protein
VTTFEYVPRNGRSVDAAFCKAGVHGASLFEYHQCNRRPWKDGWCKQHHPDTEKARDAKRNAKWDAERRADETKWARDKERKLVLVALRDWYLDSDAGPSADALLFDDDRTLREHLAACFE